MLLRAALVLLVWMPAAAVVAQGVPSHVDVFVSGTEGYFAYRIPAIETAPDGSLLAFAEARKYTLDDPGYGKQDIDLVLRRSTDQGQTWSPMQVIEDPGELWSAANPTTVVDAPDRPLWVFYLRCKPGATRKPPARVRMTVRCSCGWSRDNGVNLVGTRGPDAGQPGHERPELARDGHRPGRRNPTAVRPADRARLEIRTRSATSRSTATITAAPGIAANWCPVSTGMTNRNWSSWRMAAS